jgi:hypothetical protein
VKVVLARMVACFYGLAASLALAAETVVDFPNQAAVSQAIGRVVAAYVEPATDPCGGGRVMSILFVGGPGAPARPAVWLPARPAGRLPADLSSAAACTLRLYSDTSFPLSLTVALHSQAALYEQSVLLSARHWETVDLKLARAREAGVDLANIQALVLSPGRRHADRLTRILLADVTVRWMAAPPAAPPLRRAAPTAGPSRELVPAPKRYGYVHWAAMRVPVVAKVDVAVAGAGLAGVAAAVAAARRGMSVLLVERTGVVGGMATLAAVPIAARPDLAGGLVKELFERLAAQLQPAEQGDTAATPTPRSSLEVMKDVLLGLLRESGARLLLYTTAVAPLLEGRAVRGLLIHSKAGLQAVRARVVIDCTGDADLAAAAGAKFALGRGRDTLTQAVTLTFLLGNVDTEALCGKGRSATTTPYYQRAVAEGWWKIPFAGPANVDVVVPGLHGVVAVNCINVGGVDTLSPADLTAAHVESLPIAEQLVEFFRRYVPGCAECYLVTSATVIGVRESRRILGEYVLTAQDVLSGAVFADGVARGFYAIDIHSADPSGDAGGVRPLSFYEIPYRCLIPKGAENLLVAGRCISADHVAHGSLRVQGTTMALGEAAGVAAALCCLRHTTPRRLDGREVRAELERSGALPACGQHVRDNPALRTHGTRVTVDSCHPRFPTSGEGAIDGLVALGPYSRWVSGEAAEPHWLELEFPRPTTCTAVTLYFWPGAGPDELAYVPKVVHVQARVDGKWQTVAAVESIDELTLNVVFAPVTVRRLRLWFPAGCRADHIIRLREVTVSTPPPPAPTRTGR